MRTIRPIFACNPKFGDSGINVPGELHELWSRVNSDPEYSRSFCRREKSISGSANFERTTCDSPQTFSDGLDPLERLFSYELQCDVQRLRARPSRVGHEPLYAFDKMFNPRSHFRVEIDANEYSHDLWGAAFTAARAGSSPTPAHSRTAGCACGRRESFVPPLVCLLLPRERCKRDRRASVQFHRSDRRRP